MDKSYNVLTVVKVIHEIVQCIISITTIIMHCTWTISEVLPPSFLVYSNILVSTFTLRPNLIPWILFVLKMSLSLTFTL